MELNKMEKIWANFGKFIWFFMLSIILGVIIGAMAGDVITYRNAYFAFFVADLILFCIIFSIDSYTFLKFFATQDTLQIKTILHELSKEDKKNKE